MNTEWPSSSSMSLQPEDMFGCKHGKRGPAIAGFLNKTFDIVTDPNTNSMISWSLTGDSFIIWDHNEFSMQILPKHFKHNNLSSFVYQLNNYGFRKIGVDHQWEYENPNFQAGKKYLLTNIYRRGHNPATKKRRGMNTNGLEIRKQILKNEINESKLEIAKLKRQQSDMELHIMAFEAEVKNFEIKSKKLMTCWAKACDEIFANHDDDKKKIKLGALESPMEHNTGLNLEIEGFDGKICDDQNDQDEKLMVIESTVLLSDQNQSIDLVSPVDMGQAHGEVGLENNSADFMFWKKIFQEEDEGVCANDAKIEVDNKQAMIALDLEGMISEMIDHDDEKVNRNG